MLESTVIMLPLSIYNIRIWLKTCPFCGSLEVVKNGKRHGSQRYYCKNCDRFFTGKREASADDLWVLYLQGLTYDQIGREYGISSSSVKRKLKDYEEEYTPPITGSGVIHVDVTYWGRDKGLLVVIDAATKQVLYYEWLFHRECKEDYKKAVTCLQRNNYNIKAIVMDAGPGFSLLKDSYPVQLCQYHFISSIRRKLTNHPKLPASIELLHIAKSIAGLSEEEFEAKFNDWEERWDEFLKERTYNEATGKPQYKHRSVRSARKTIRTQLPYLFTYKKFADLEIPNTNNAMEGFFTSLKSSLRNHNGMSQANKERFVKGFFLHKGIVQLTRKNKKGEAR